MLVIRRHPGEAIQIGDEVEIVVMECGAGRVKLGIRAPKEIAVMRAEVRSTREQNLAAACAWESGAGFALTAGLRDRFPPIQVPEVGTDKQL